MSQSIDMESNNNTKKLDEINEKFVFDLQKQSIELSNIQTKQFRQYYHLLMEWNQKINLTAITEPEEVYYKHFYDSLTLTMTYPNVAGNFAMIDVGSGAGFPGIPLKILHPELKITFLDSLNKRIKYLQTITDELRLRDCKFVHGRAEEVAHRPEYREAFDFAVARAVAKIAVLNELCLPFIRVKGCFYAMKGPDVEMELKEAKKSLQILKAKINNTIELKLPHDYGKRTIIEIKKTDRIPRQYPRKPGTPSKMPLI